MNFREQIMPYYIYQIPQDKQLECLEKHDNYRKARDQVRQLRAALNQDDSALIRLIHAGTEAEAERLLLTPRQAPIEGDD